MSRTSRRSLLGVSGVAVAAVAGAVLAAQGLAGEPDPGGADRATPAAVPTQSVTAALSGGGEVLVGDLRFTATVRPGQGDSAAELALSATDATTGAPRDLPSRPVAWLDRRRSGDDGSAASCEDKAQMFSQGRLGATPDVDLNSYRVVTLNEDASLSVIDPLVDVGGMSQLFAMPALSSPGEDWALSPDGRRLFVTLPRSGKVAVVETGRYTVELEADAGPAPTAIALDPTGTQLWVSNDPGDGRTGGVTVLDARDLSRLASTTTAPGPLRVVFPGHAAADDHAGHPAPSGAATAAVAHRDGTVALLDAETGDELHRVRLDGRVTDLVAVPGSDRLYAALAGDAAVVALDGGRHEVVGRVDGARDVTRLAVVPGGAHALALSPGRGTVTVFETATGTVRSSTAVDGAPDEVAFTDGFAHLRGTTAAQLALLPLGQIDAPVLSPISVGVGQEPPASADVEASAAGIATVHGSDVLVANPSDRYLYMYMPGMNAPMGGLRTYGKTPRAVTVVDRGLREEAPGRYSAAVTVPEPGTYDLAVVLAEPRSVACFTVTAQGSGTDDAPAPPAAVELVGDDASLVPGRPGELRLRLVDADGAPVRGARDVQVLATLASGSGDARAVARPQDDGSYSVELVLPSAGRYTLQVGVPSLGVPLGRLPALAVETTP